MTDAQCRDLERDMIGVELRRAVLDAEEAYRAGQPIDLRLLRESAAALSEIIAGYGNTQEKAA